MWTSTCHTCHSPQECFCNLLHVTAPLKNCGGQICTQNLLNWGSMTSLSILRLLAWQVSCKCHVKRAILTSLFREAQHKLVFKANLFPTVTIAWRKGVWGRKSWSEVKGQLRYKNSFTSVPALTHSVTMDSWNHRMVCAGRVFEDYLVPPHPAMGRDTFHQTRLLKAPSNLSLNTSRDGEVYVSN